MKSIMQPLYKFVRFCNLCIAITINLFLVISRYGACIWVLIGLLPNILCGVISLENVKI